MPVYEYRCDACSATIEAVRPLVDRDDTPRCPKCARLTRRVISSTNFVLRGDGWAKDGYAGRKP